MDQFITPRGLASKLHRADAPTIIDLRDAADASADPRRIPGARSATLAEVDGAAAIDRPVVCTCQKGGKLSQLGAAMVRARGGRAMALAGGHLAWLAADLPTVRSSLAARWVMPLDPDWDGLAALWVLRRLVDRGARTMAVERDWLAPAAAVWSAHVLPPTAEAMAELAVLRHPTVPRLRGGPGSILAGRLTRVGDPDGALDLIDDWLAGQAA